ncbi:Zinc finger Ran-binding domain-containing protein [Actinidia chinensis var. chinensis]|uniref:Zinc finger Ran-binding domain-containing protein n=1 Tax=Actinidia chinensis var. chinensis TaxID=1590841 RepID=A0A2R6R4K1_ACTCC|nr:Zinc finger Ran-binding domain-containing protein [Actinidia chinensis var. chinensis]
MSREGGDWMCSSCQHLNFKKRDLCQRCRCPKFGVGTDVSRTEVDLAGDWYCNAMNCGAHNYASRTSCYRCGTPYGLCSGGAVVEGGLPGWKSGDWICNRLGCGVHNYACRVECFKCKTPRNFDGAI